MKPKHFKIQNHQNPVHTNWLDFINDDRCRLTVPVGPRFQADVPDWTVPTHENYPNSSDSVSNISRWLGTQLWPIKGRKPQTKEDEICKSRHNLCLCISPGSIECNRRHIAEKWIWLQSELGPAFWRMKFDDMGEEVSKLWNLEEQKKFESLVKMNPVSQGRSFMKPALDCLPSHNKQSIVSYYFNVYIPRRISKQTRSGCTLIDTDDDEAKQAAEPKVSRKRCQADSAASLSSKYVKIRYLTGRR